MDGTIRVVIMGAGARGNKVFADLIARYNTGFALAGVVEPWGERRAAFCETYDIPPEHAFASTDEFLDAPRIGDIVFICTPDVTHFALCKAVSEKGYDVLLEKPIATNLPDCLALLDVEQSCRNRIIVAHVLRYSPFFRKVQETIRSGRLGSVRHIRLTENIGHWHFAHSYVRGNWRRSDETAPIILTKSCHDLDILYWLMGEAVTSVSSFGALTYFRPDNAPAGATERCVDCPHEHDCLYSATRFYLNHRNEWPFDVVAPYLGSLAPRAHAIATGPYGRCVYLNDNDVPDNQVVVLQFESGVLADFSLHAHTAEDTRKLNILFEKGELEGNLYRNDLQIAHFTGAPDESRIEPIVLPGQPDRHGGGDLELLYVLFEHLTSGGHQELVTSLRNSLPSHVLAFLAEDSRISGGDRVPVPEIFELAGPPLPAEG